MADLAGSAQQSLLGYGVVGLIAFGGLYFAWRTHERALKRADDAEARLYALQEAVRTELVPALTRATDAAGRMTELVAPLSDLLERTSWLMDRHARPPDPFPPAKRRS